MVSRKDLFVQRCNFIEMMVHKFRLSLIIFISCLTVNCSKSPDTFPSAADQTCGVIRMGSSFIKVVKEDVIISTLMEIRNTSSDQHVPVNKYNQFNKIMESLKAIKPGPKPKREDGGLDERRRVAPSNKPKYDPPLKPEKPKK